MYVDKFTWVKRIKAAIGFACLLKFLYGKNEPYVVFNLDPPHIIFDQEYNPMLFDFGLLHGGSIGELSSQKKKIFMATGYVDSCYAGTVQRSISKVQIHLLGGGGEVFQIQLQFTAARRGKVRGNILVFGSLA